MEAVWQRVKNSMKSRIPTHCYRMWIEPVEFLRFSNQLLTLSCPNNFCRKRLQDQYAEEIRKSLQATMDQPLQLVFEVHAANGNGNGSGSRKDSADHQLPLPNMNVRLHNGRLLRRDFTFDQFCGWGQQRLRLFRGPVPRLPQLDRPQHPVPAGTYRYGQKAISPRRWVTIYCPKIPRSGPITSRPRTSPTK